MAAKLGVKAPAVTLLLATCLLVLAAAVAGARPLALLETKDGARAVESPVGGDIQAVVGTVEHDGRGSGAGIPGLKFMNVGMLVGIKDSGPSPGAGH